MTHRFIPTQPVPRTRPTPSDIPVRPFAQVVAEKCGGDFPAVGAVLWSAVVSS